MHTCICTLRCESQKKTGYFQRMTTGSDVAAGTAACYEVSLSCDDVCPYPFSHSAHFACTYTGIAHIHKCMLTQILNSWFFMCFSLDLTFTLLFCRLWLWFSIEVLIAIPPVLEIMYLSVWRVSLRWCPPFLGVCHLLLTHMCAKDRVQSGENWMRSFRCFPRDYDRSGLYFLYCPAL